MKKTLLIAAFLTAMAGGNTMHAQTDVTAEYLLNAGFESGNAGDVKSSAKGYFAPESWTATNLPTSGTLNFGVQTGTETADTHPGAFGVVIAPSEGNRYYFGRNSWASALTTSFAQTTSKALPAGKYMLVADYKIATKLANTGGTFQIQALKEGTVIASASTTTAGVPQSGTYFNEAQWSPVSTVFVLDTESTIDVNLIMAFNPNKVNTQQEAIAIDNVRILEISGIGVDNPLDVTGFVKNRNFDLSTASWTTTTGAQNSALATNKQGDFTGRFWENWKSTAYTGKMSQTMTAIPNGTYKLKMAAFASTIDASNAGSAAVFANSDLTPLTSTDPTFYEVYTYVSGNSLEIGLKQDAALANWMGIDNISLTYYGEEDVVSLLRAGSHKTAYDEAIAAANAALSAEANAVVTGEERTALAALVAAEEPTTIEGYDEAAAALKTVTNTLNAAAAAYQAYANAKAATYDTAPYTYATEASKTTLSDALVATDATNAADATAKTLAITVAYRAIIESHVNAEGVDGAVNFTSSIVNPTVAADQTTIAPWTTTGGNTRIMSGEGWFDASNTQAAKYYDTNNWSANSWNEDFSQTITLPTGTYILSAIGRSFGPSEFSVYAGTASAPLPKVGNTGNAFNGGWNYGTVEFTVKTDHNVKIGVKGVTTVNHSWASFSDFRLYKIADVIADKVMLSETATEAPAANDYADVTVDRNYGVGWNSLVLPFDVTAEEIESLGLSVIEYTGTTSEGANSYIVQFTPATSIKANVPVLFKATAAGNFSDIAFLGKKVAPSTTLEAASSDPAFTLTGLYTAATASTIQAGDYICTSAGIMKATGGNALKAFRAYFRQKPEVSSEARLRFVVDGEEVTGIDAVQMREALEGPVYNLQGQKLNHLQKGINIVNGKKILVK